MRVLVFSKNIEHSITKLLMKHDFKLVKSNPDVVLSVGGDGTLLLAEHKWPGIPKLHIGRSKTCGKCSILSPGRAITALANGTLHIRNEPTLQAILTTNGKHTTLPVALNDVIVRNAHPSHALRFSVKSKTHTWQNCIGDGIVVCTPFGSTAYYRSITKSQFTKGIGLAFNNPVSHQKPLVLKEHDNIVLTVSRGDGVIAVDTLDRTWRANAGDRITITQSPTVAKILTLK